MKLLKQRSKQLRQRKPRKQRPNLQTKLRLKKQRNRTSFVQSACTLNLKAVPRKTSQVICQVAGFGH